MGTFLSFGRLMLRAQEKLAPKLGISENDFQSSNPPFDWILF